MDEERLLNVIMFMLTDTIVPSLCVLIYIMLSITN